MRLSCISDLKMSWRISSFVSPTLVFILVGQIYFLSLEIRFKDHKAHFSIKQYFSISNIKQLHEFQNSNYYLNAFDTFYIKHNHKDGVYNEPGILNKIPLLYTFHVFTNSFLLKLFTFCKQKFLFIVVLVIL